MVARNIKLTIIYDGSEYRGWQIQPGQKTIQGVVTEAIQDLTGCEVRVHGASRTDAGVSALGQVALVQLDSPIPTKNLAEAITHRLPADIAIAEAVEVPQGFDVIGAVKSKLYRYTIFTGTLRPVLQIRHCWHLPARLDTAAMAEAGRMLIGKKDFKSFAAADDKRVSSVRTIFRCDVNSSCVVRDASCGRRLTAEKMRDTENIDSCLRRNDNTEHNTQYAIRNTQHENDWVNVDVEGDAFLYNMVRNIVGTLVEIGRGRWKPEKTSEILQAKDRRAAGPIAPAEGLCLMWVKYA